MAINWEAAGAIGEILGAVVVVVTIIYLSMQVRHAREATVAATELEASVHLSRLTERIADTPSLQETWNVFAKHEDVSPEAAQEYLWHMATYCHLAEGVWEQHRRGFLSEHSWKEWERVIVGVLSPPVPAAWWEQRLGPFSTEFYDFVDQRLEDSRGEWVQPSPENLPVVRDGQGDA